MPLECSLQSLDLADFAADLAGPYALHHFFPAGALRLQLKVKASSCSHDHQSTSWHHYPGHGGLAGLVRAEYEQFTRLLDFLIVHKFIAATCCVCSPSYHPMLLIRVYLIPYDLANVEGRLRRRDEATVLGPARKYLRTVLPRLSRDLGMWEGEADGSSSLTFFDDDDADNRTLAELYNTLPSPAIHEDQYASVPLAHEILGGAPISGLKSSLYAYQRRSVAAMIQRELQPGSIPDPLYVPLYGLGGTNFYFQPATMEVLRDCPTVAQTRGGILCEELGTGKTVMSLALILATLEQLPTPEESYLDPRPVLTPLSLRHFPSDVYVDAREKCGAPLRKRQKTDTSRIPSLTEHVLHLCSTNPSETGVRGNEDLLKDRGLWKAFKANVPFYHHYDDEPLEALRNRRAARGGGDPKSPRAMYLSGATLVVVPPNLLNQWFNEINKHCNPTLRVYMVMDNTDLPHVKKLALYDVVLMTHARLSHEAGKMGRDKTKSLHSLKTCDCPPRDGCPVRVPRCRCKVPKGVSPLLRIRWKRLLVDEGNNLSDTTTALMGCIEQLSIERKWIVTGTPTTNLMGLHFGFGSKLMYPEDEAQDMDEETSTSLDYRQHILEERGSSPESDSGDSMPSSPASVGQLPENAASGSASPASSSSSSHRSARVWSKNDRQDLNKLGAMISSFLQIPRFAADSKLFSSCVVAPVMDPAGPKPGSIQVLRQVMQSAMIRHRIQDIEKEVLLPLLHHETVLLDLDPMAVKTYNVLQGSIAINLVSSEREGADWIFHPRNTAALQQMIENISQTMFWHMDEDTFKIDESISMGPRFVEAARTRGVVSEDDITMLEESLHHLERAQSDPVWHALMHHPYVFTRVYNMPTPIYEKWSNLPADIGEVADAHGPIPFKFMTPDRLRPLRNYVQSNPLASVGRLLRLGEWFEESDRLHAKWIAEQSRLRKDMKKLRESDKKQTKTTPVASNETLKRLLEAQKRYKEEFHSVTDEPNSTLLSESPIAGVRVGNSASSKLNYILNEVRIHSESSKFLIFSKSPLTLLYVAEGLNLMGVKYKLTSRKRVREVEQDVMTFESSDMYRVFLMELKHGARGLNIITASRVIFCEPVWQADVETQAIKRVHRIGQTKPVSVKTLAIRSTAEEVMVARRDALKRGLGAAGGRLPNLAEDNVMREFIANPKFLPDPPADTLVLDYPLLPEVAVHDENPTGVLERHITPEPLEPTPSTLDEPSPSRIRDSPKLVIKLSPRKRARETAVSDEGVEHDDSVGASEPARKKPRARAVRFVDEA